MKQWIARALNVQPGDLGCGLVVRKNSIRLPSDRDAGTYLFGFPALGSPKNQSCEQKMLLSRADPVQS
jgi:hypothetical protein